MSLDEPFPLDAVPSRVRQAILNEFNRCCPSMREVTEISDRDWLTVPGIGPAALERIRSVTNERLWQITRSSSARLSDAELLERLEWLQRELRWLKDRLKARLPKMAAGDETGRQEVPQASDSHA